MSIAQTILAQLGGNRFTAMTGSKNFVDHGDALSMTLVRGVKNKATKLKITLRGDDTYRVEFGKMKRNFDYVEVKTFDQVYADQLKEIFENETGFYTSL